MASFAVTCLILYLITNVYAAPKGHLKPIGHSGPNHAVEETVGFVKPATFVSEYLLNHRPVVMRGAVKDTPAFKKWNDQYLRSVTPEGKTGNVFIEYGKKENRSEPSEDVHFTKFLDIYNKSDIYMVHHVPAFLAPDVTMPFCIQCDAFNQSFADTVMWFSSGGTKSVFHNDGNDNINCLFRGKKHLVMANATQYKKLMPKILDVRHLSHSSVDVEKVDLVKYPLFVGMDFHIVDMEAGDCLYIPVGWMHHVTSFGSNLAVNVWFTVENEKIDLKTCRNQVDRSITLDKFRYSMKEEEEAQDMEPPSPPEVQPKKYKAPKKDAKKKSKISTAGLSIDPVMDNIADVTMGKKQEVVKTKFIKKMTEGKKMKEDEMTLLKAIFNTLDVNKNHKFDMTDFETRMSPKKEKLFLKGITAWQKVARKYKLSYDLTLKAPAGATAPETGEDESEEMPEEEAGEGPSPQQFKTSRNSMPTLEKVVYSISDHHEL